MPRIETHLLIEPFVILDIPNVNTEFLLERLISFSYTYAKKKRDHGSITFEDEDRDITNGSMLGINEVWTVRWGWEGYTLSPVVYMTLKKWETTYDTGFPIVTCELVVTKGKAKQEFGKYKKGKNWGKKHSSEIAKSIAKKYNLNYDIDESNDKEDIDYYQPIGVGDYEYLQFLSDEIGFEFKIEANKLYYKERSYDSNLKYQFWHYPDNEVLDNVLISFKPEVKVIPKNTKTTGNNPKELEKKKASVSKQDKSKLEALNKDLIITDEAIAISKKAVAQKNNQLQQADAYLKKVIQDEGIASPNVILAAKASFDAGKDLGYAISQDRKIRMGAAEILSYYQNEDYMTNISTLNGDAKDCKPSSAKTSSTKEEEKQAYLQLGLDNERSENIIEPVENTLSSTSSDSKRSKIACAKNREKTEKSVKADLECLGLPFLKDRDNISIIGVGPKFSGIWHIVECTHSIGADYKTTCELKRGVLNTKKSKTEKKTNKASDTALKEETYVLELGLDDARTEVLKKT